MHRRGLAHIVVALRVAVLTAILVVGLGLGPGATPSFATGDQPPPPPTVEDAPPVTVSDFFPEEENLSDCLGLVEKPGCGSESRGGWRQTAVFGVVIVGIAFIIWRISIGIRRNRPDEPTPEPQRSTDPMTRTE